MATPSDNDNDSKYARFYLFARRGLFRARFVVLKGDAKLRFEDLTIDLLGTWGTI
eukprot:gene18647-25163_t